MGSGFQVALPAWSVADGAKKHKLQKRERILIQTFYQSLIPVDKRKRDSNVVALERRTRLSARCDGKMRVLLPRAIMVKIGTAV
jgi:hypothetical protein